MKKEIRASERVIGHLKKCYREKWKAGYEDPEIWEDLLEKCTDEEIESALVHYTKRSRFFGNEPPKSFNFFLFCKRGEDH
jgi:hypothetical protein